MTIILRDNFFAKVIIIIREKNYYGYE